MTSAPNSRTATHREGPFNIMHSVEDRLREITAEGQDLEDELELENETEERIIAVCREGWTHRLFDTCREWVSATNAARETRAANGTFVPGTAQYDPVISGNFGKGYKPTPIETRPATLAAKVAYIANLARAWAEL